MNTYRLYPLDPRSFTISAAPTILEVASDEEAIALAHAADAPLPSELWCGTRLVMRRPEHGMRRSPATAPAFHPRPESGLRGEVA